MKRILKKNQLIIAALAVMIAAGRISELFRKIITGTSEYEGGGQ